MPVWESKNKRSWTEFHR